MRAQFITAEEVQQVLDISRSKSSQILISNSKVWAIIPLPVNAQSSSLSRSFTVWKLEVTTLDAGK